MNHGLSRIIFHGILPGSHRETKKPEAADDDPKSIQSASEKLTIEFNDEMIILMINR